MVESTCVGMPSSLVDWPPRRRDTRVSAVAFGFVGLPHVNTPCLVSCVVLTGAGLEFTIRTKSTCSHNHFTN